MNNRHFKPRSACYTCRSCGRFTRDTDGSSGSLELCHECHEWISAENTLSDAGDSLPASERTAIQAYIVQMQQQAVAKGGTLADSETPMNDATPPTAAIPAAAPIPQAEIPQAEIPPLVFPVKRPPNDRGQGRKALPPGWKLETVTVRVTREQKQKLKRLGAEWLRTAIQRARDPGSNSGPIPGPVDLGTPDAHNAAQ